MWLRALLRAALCRDGLLDAYRCVRSRDKISGPLGVRGESHQFWVELRASSSIYRLWVGREAGDGYVGTREGFPGVLLRCLLVEQVFGRGSSSSEAQLK